MPKFSKKSTSQLATCDRDIQTIFQEVVKVRDCTIVEGHRTAERQAEHWAKGRKLRPGSDRKQRSSWKKVGPVVTFKDGYEKKSRHQTYPSVAVDVVPYPEMWGSEEAFAELRGVVKAVQYRLLQEGKISKTIANGNDLWKGFDKPHWEYADV